MGGGKRRTETARGGRIDPDDKTILNQIMLRFRPIAPRPATVESSVCVPPVKEKRVKRKYVQVKKRNLITNLTMQDDVSLNRSVKGVEFVTDPVRRVSIPEWISFDLSGVHKEGEEDMNMRWKTNGSANRQLHEVDLAIGVKRERVVETWITIESVIGTCEDEEIWKDLETDRCPGFISNSEDEVQWVNLAYRRMVDPEGEGEGEVVVWLGVKVEKAAFEYWQAFTCRVSVAYLVSEKKKRMTVPCDVWKMDSGGYAWRLDVKAALSLGSLS